MPNVSVQKVTLNPTRSVLHKAPLARIPIACIRPPSTPAEVDLAYDLWFLLRYPGTQLKPKDACLERAINRAIIIELQAQGFLSGQDNDPGLAIQTAADIWDIIASTHRLVDVIRWQDSREFVRYAEIAADQARQILHGYEPTPAPVHAQTPTGNGGASYGQSASAGLDEETLRRWFNALQRIFARMTPENRTTATTLHPRIARDILRAIALRQSMNVPPNAMPDAGRLFDEDAATRLTQAANDLRADDGATAKQMEQLARLVQSIADSASEDLRRMLESLDGDDTALALLAAASIADHARFTQFARQGTDSNDLALQAFRDAVRDILNAQKRDAHAEDSAQIAALNHLLAQPEEDVLARMRAARDALQRISSESVQRAVDALRTMGLSDGTPGSPPDDDAIRQAARALRGDRDAFPADQADAVDQAMQPIRMEAVRDALDALRHADLLPDAPQSGDAPDRHAMQTLGNMQRLLEMANDRPDDLAAAMRAARDALQRISSESVQRAVDALRTMGLSDGTPGSPPDDDAIRQAARALRGDRDAFPADQADAVDQAMQPIRMEAVRDALDALRRTLMTDHDSRTPARDDTACADDFVTYDSCLHRLSDADSALSGDDARAIHDAIREALAHPHAAESDALHALMHTLQQRGYAADDETVHSLVETRNRLCDHVGCDSDADIEGLTRAIHDDAIRRIIDEMRRRAGEPETATMPPTDEERRMAHAMLQSLFESAEEHADIDPDDLAWMNNAARVLQTIMMPQSGAGAGTSAGAPGMPMSAPSGAPGMSKGAPPGAPGDPADGADGSDPAMSRPPGDRSMFDLAQQLATVDVDIDFTALPGVAIDAPDTDSPYAGYIEDMVTAVDRRQDDRPAASPGDEDLPDNRWEPLEEPQSALHPGRLRAPESPTEEEINDLRARIEQMVQQVNDIIAQEITPERIEEALAGTLSVRDVLNDFGIDAGELKAVPIDDIVALATEINAAGTDLHDMLVAFGDVNSVFQNVAEGDPAKRNPFGMPTIEPTDDIFAVMSFDPSVVTSNRAVTAMRVRDLANGVLLGFVDPPDKTSRGPLVCAIDDSGSMSADHRRVVAHAIALAMAAEAVREEREVHLIKFSGPHDNLDIYRYPDPDHPNEPRLRAVSRLLNWATIAIDGGTDFDRPLMKIAEIAEASLLNGCDAVFITDAGATVSHPVIERWRATCEERDLGLLAFVIGGEERDIAQIGPVSTEIYTFPPGSFTGASIAPIIAAFLRSRRDGGMRHAGAAQRSERRQFELTRR